MLAFAALFAVLPLALAAPLVERATDISGSPGETFRASYSAYRSGWNRTNISLSPTAVGFKLPVARGWSDATDSASPCGGIGERVAVPRE